MPQTDYRPGDRVRIAVGPDTGLCGTVVENCPKSGGVLVRFKWSDGRERNGGLGYAEVEFWPLSAWERLIGPDVDFG